jgi:hypothetical protein
MLWVIELTDQRFGSASQVYVQGYPLQACFCCECNSLQCHVGTCHARDTHIKP